VGQVQGVSDARKRMPARVLAECIVLTNCANHVWDASLGMESKKLGRYCDASLVAKCGPLRTSFGRS
jgi:hypothetical protein